MAKRRTEPDYTTQLGKLLELVFIQHPHVKTKWKEEALSFHRQMPDISILNSLIKNYEDICAITYKVMILPYTVEAHNKLKNIKKYNRLYK